MGSWGISASVQKALADYCRYNKIGTIVELGTGEGISLLAIAANVLSSTTIYSVDNSDYYFTLAKAKFPDKHQPNNVSFILAPIVSGWYNRKNLEGIVGPIDMLFVDGPQGIYDRGPALEVFYGRLAQGAVIFLDDVNRDREAATFQAWKAWLKRRGRTFTSVIDNTERGLGRIILDR